MNLHYDPELAFLPGLDGTGISFEPLSKELPPSLHTTVVTYPRTTDHTWQDLVQSADDQLPSDKSIVILAESFSGPVAIKLLSRSDHNVLGVIFCATFAKAPRPSLLYLLSALPLSLLFRIRLAESMPDSFFGGKKYAGVLRPLFKRVNDELPPEVLAHRTKMLTGLDVVPDLSALDLPCCYIQATDDKLVPESSLLPFQFALPDLVVNRVQEPHYILQARPRECAGRILDFMSHLTTD